MNQLCQAAPSLTVAHDWQQLALPGFPPRRLRLKQVFGGIRLCPLGVRRLKLKLRLVLLATGYCMEIAPNNRHLPRTSNRSDGARVSALARIIHTVSQHAGVQEAPVQALHRFSNLNKNPGPAVEDFHVSTMRRCNPKNTKATSSNHPT